MSREREASVRGKRNRSGKSAGPDSQALVIDILTFFGRDPSEAERFFAWSGLDPASLRSAAADPGFALGVLDYFAENLPSLERFCSATGDDPGGVLVLHETLKVRGLTSHDDP